MPPSPIGIPLFQLLAITDTGMLGWPELEAAASAALEAGLPALMIRDRLTPDDVLLPIAERLRQRARDCGGRLIMNRRLELARRIGADGVHLGAHGPSLAEARQMLGDKVLIGYSAHAIAEAREALASGADYVTFSPIFATPSKAGILEPVGLQALREMAQGAPGRVVALGGIGLENIGEVMRTGVRGAAVIRAIFGTPDPAAAVKSLLTALSGTE